MVYTVTLEEMEFRASHGCYDLEKVVGNHFSVSLSIDAELDEAAEADDVTRTINYQLVYDIVAREMCIPSNILEHVALRIIRAIQTAFPQAIKVKITVSKQAPPLGGKVKSASVTLSGSRFC